ncbi:hypothetical protein V5799_022645 [Amblyomma americanum]|uniref:Transmembrane protein n=1 Tax=Amblyomma americanum TaxID=6943 RepID=A0AAQ4FJW3_AMBAM
MDVRRSLGKIEGERPAATESPRRCSSVYSLRSTSLSIEERQDCRSLSHLGILMPLYLMPLFFLGTKYGGCLYCLLLPLLLLAFNSLPKPSAALVHLVTVPLLELMAPEEIARQYLCPCRRHDCGPLYEVNTRHSRSSRVATQADILTVALVLFLVVVVDRWSELVLHLACGVCARFGLQRKRLFVGTCLSSFAFAWLFSGPLVSVTLLYFLDRVLSTIYKENMDRTPDVSSRSPRRGSVQESSSMRSLSAADQVLFDRLAQVALSLKKPERRKWRHRQPPAEDKVVERNEPDAAATPMASGTDAVPQAAGMPTDDVIHPGSAPVEFGTHLDLQKTLPSVVTDSDPPVSVALASGVSEPVPSKPTGEETKTGRSEPESVTNLPCEKFGLVKSDFENPTEKSANNVSRQESAKPADGERLCQATDIVEPASAREDAREEDKIEGQGVHQDDKISQFKTSHTEDRSAASRKEKQSENVSRGSLDKPSENHPPNYESKGTAKEHPQRLEPVFLAGDERPMSKSSAADPSRNMGQQDDVKASAGFPLEEKGPSNEAKSYGAALPETKPQPSVKGTEEPGLYLRGKDPGHRTEKSPRKRSKDSQGKPSQHHSSRRKSTASVSERNDGFKEVPGEKQENCSRKSSAADVLAKKERSLATKGSGSVPKEKKHQTLKDSTDKVVPVKTEQKSGVKGSEEPNRNQPDDDPEKGKGKRSRRTSKDSLNNQPHPRSRRRKSKASIGDPVEGLQAVPTGKEARHPPQKCSKADSLIGSVAGAAEEVNAREGENPRDTLRREHFERVLPPVHPQACKTETAVPGASDSKRMHHQKDKIRGSTDSGRQKTELVVKSHTSLPDKHLRDKHPSAQLEASKPEATAAAEAESRRGPIRERQHGSHADGKSNASRRSKTSGKSRRRSDAPEIKDHAAGATNASSAHNGEQKPADKRLSKEAVSSKHPAETRHIRESASTRRGATAPETEKPLQSARPASSEETRSSHDSKLGPRAVQSKLQPQQATSSATAPKAGAPNEADTTTTMELKRKQSVVSFGADLLAAIKPEPVPLMSRVTVHTEEAAVRPSKVRRLSTILKTSSLPTTVRRRGSSVDFGAAKFTIIRAETANQSMGSFTWAIVTMPGALMALFMCTVVIWLIYIRPQGIECAYAAYLAIFSLSYVPSLVLGLEPR